MFSGRLFIEQQRIELGQEAAAKAPGIKKEGGEGRESWWSSAHTAVKRNKEL